MQCDVGGRRRREEGGIVWMDEWYKRWGESFRWIERWGHGWMKSEVMIRMIDKLLLHVLFGSKMLCTHT